MQRIYWRSAIASLGCVIAAGVSSANSAEFSLPETMEGETVLYVGAHPDDEWGVTPILADACIERGAKCVFLVVADAKSYGCLLTIGLRDPEECSRRRREEMRKAAEMFGGTVEFLGMEDVFYAFNQIGMEHAIADWSAASGGRAKLVGRIEEVLRREKPRFVFTFDPRHGSSCHAGHRATATLLVEAVNRLPKRRRPPVWLEQTVDATERVPEQAAIIEAGGYVGWPDTVQETVWFDASTPLSSGLTGFDYVIAERKHHATQMPDEASGERVLNPPLSTRRVPIARLKGSAAGDFCTSLKLDRPTLDVPGNREKFGIE